MALLLILIVFFKSFSNSKKEGFQQTDNFLFKTGDEIYDNSVKTQLKKLQQNFAVTIGA